ncbi:hypothetical protein AGR4C_Lc60030 [Agrobacterium tumefaciens str. Kerr 14]|uniref:Uncharacterized protein n=1 Tax=Agrobacterium tumefaciens str. Kerr 14 TaxID=1183424 RepID=A0A1S7S228_AGRTU|nr:hypothetical protein AGR4C_Lc60030 [Agrobacterium tumefaciens str. Kerr 14]
MNIGTGDRRFWNLIPGVLLLGDMSPELPSIYALAWWSSRLGLHRFSGLLTSESQTSR